MRYQHATALIIGLPLLLVAIVGFVQAQEPVVAARPEVVDDQQASQSQDERRAADALALTGRVARSIKIYGGKERTTKLTLVESPLQRFSNPVVGEFYAHLFIWINKGRPKAVVSIQKWYAPNQALHVELQSLATDPLTAEYKEAMLWHPEEAGVAFKIVPGSAVPARRAPARLREMRTLARDFHTRIKAINRGGDIDEELRLLTRPVYRYESKDPAVLDGAVFSFVRGTDPKLLLLIEAIRVSNGFAWQYAFAPMNSLEFHAFHQNREVWQKAQLAPPWTNVMDTTKPYFLIVNFDERVTTEGNKP